MLPVTTGLLSLNSFHCWYHFESLCSTTPVASLQSRIIIISNNHICLKTLQLQNIKMPTFTTACYLKFNLDHFCKFLFGNQMEVSCESPIIFIHIVFSSAAVEYKDKKIPTHLLQFSSLSSLHLLLLVQCAILVSLKNPWKNTWILVKKKNRIYKVYNVHSTVYQTSSAWPVHWLQW